MRLHAGGVNGGGNPTSPPPPGCYEAFNYFFEVIEDGDTLTFVPNIDPSANVTQVVWDFGDGSPVVSDGVPTTIIHTFPSDGNFLVNMAVYTDNNCNGLYTRNVVSNCVMYGTITTLNRMETRNSTDTAVPVGITYGQAETLRACDIPDALSGLVRMGWMNLEIGCCATFPIYLEPRVSGNYISAGTTCVRTGAETFLYTAKHCITPGADRVFTIESPVFNVNYNGPYTDIPIWFTWVSGSRELGCNADLIFSLEGCGRFDHSLFGYFLFASTTGPC